MSTTTTASERAELAKIALLVASEAAALAAGGYRSHPHADKKGRADLVTEFDRASEALVFERLGALAPEIPIVGEEATGDSDARQGLRFYVDPIDGTTNFVHGHPFWCVAVGLAQDDEPIAGAVVAPAIAVTWSGWVADTSAPVGDPRRGDPRRNGEPCRVSDVADFEDALVATGFPPDRHGPGNNFDSFMSVKRAAQAVRRCGSAAMDLCLVADGTYDGYWERRLHAWDTMAAAAIAIAAGARITAIDGGPPDYHRGYLIASNGRIHDALRAKVDV